MCTRSYNFYKRGPSAFTLLELMVAITIFLMIMTMATFFFQSMSSGMVKTIEILELNRKADAIIRYLAYDMRNLQQTTAIQLIDNTTDPLSMTFMVATTDQGRDPIYFGEAADGRLDFEGKLPRRADFVWTHWKFENGSFYRGESRRAHNLSNGTESHSNNWNENLLMDNTSSEYLTVLDLKSPIPMGIQNNHISPTPQREFIYFEGLGSPTSVGADGAASGGAKSRIQVSQTMTPASFTGGSCDILDGLSAPWRMDGNYSHLYTTIAVGNQGALSKDAYAVVNQDGVSVNKDRINLLGTDDVDSDGDHIYPSQLRLFFDGVEYVSISLERTDGTAISAGNEDDTLTDGATSFDVSGIHPVTGAGMEERPVVMRMSYLLHTIAPHIEDDGDFDSDGDATESLADAIRSYVASQSLSTRLENIHEFQKHCLKLGYFSIYMNQSIRMGL